MADTYEPPHRFESNETLRWADGVFVTVNGVATPWPVDGSQVGEESVVIIAHDEKGNRAEFDFDAEEATRIARAIDRAVAGVRAAR